LKTLAYLSSLSATVLASLIDSLIDLVISLLNFLAIRHAMKPADADHRYGHGKVEGLAALFQAAFLASGGFFILLEAMQRLINPVAMNAHFFAGSIMGISLLMTLFLVAVQRMSLKKSPSLAVEADKMHYMGDVVMYLGILAVIAGDYFGAPAWIDPLGAIAITVYLGLSAYKIAKKGIDMLLDREVSGEVREKIITTVLSHQQIHGVHDLRTRAHGLAMHISFDVEIDPKLMLCEAHAITKELEAELLHHFPNAQIMIHKDPIGDTEDSRHQVAGIHD
jgi:ferrous-iron efflux pump FieF